MGKGFFEVGLVILATMGSGAIMAQQLDKGRDANTAAPNTSSITFGGNFVADPCQTCKYNSEPSGFFVWGRDNCTSPGDIQSVAVPIIAAANGIPNRILTSIILNNPTDCPTDTVTLGLYTDTCGDGPGTLLAQTEATVADAACGLTIAKLAGAPALSEGTKYWITATTRRRGRSRFEVVCFQQCGFSV